MRIRRATRLCSAAGAIALALFLGVTGAEACVCVQATTMKLVDHATDAFVARVIAGPLPVAIGGVQDPTPDEIMVDRVAYTVQVTDSLKGPLRRRSQIQVITPASEAACGYVFKPGELYLILAKRHPAGLITTSCRGNATGESLPGAVLGVRRVVGVPPPPPPPLIP